ncbi:hypothetical protein ACPWT1_16740 [Ramlibacter sp. MMS24-I3-19]|uniref:hypothetical protein n=1 Tax=Ramlibacter sp. MMS24-I3-19 TaxID=3416606 RepID=UPI003D0676FF
MSSKSSSTSQSSDAKDSATSGAAALATQWPELSRQQFARSVDLMAAAFRAGQAVQQVNLQMSERAALLHSQAAENARKATSPTELLQIQSTLMVYELQEVTRYSQELLLACSRAVGQPAATVLGEQTANGTASSTRVGSLADAAIGAAGPMVQAWQQMFTPGMQPDGATQQAKH